MTKNERSFLKRYITPVLFVLAFICALFSVLYVVANFELEDTRLTYAQPSAFAGGWSVQTAAGDVALAEPSRPAAGNTDGTLRLVNTLPANLQDGTTLGFQTKNESVRVWAGDELIYSYGDTPQQAYGHGVGAIWNLALLPATAAGQTVAVELTPVDARTGLTAYTFLLGNRSDIVSHLLHEDLAMLAVCIMLIVIGLGALVITVLGLVRHNQWVTATSFFFALFVLLAALWTATDSGLMQFWMQNKGASYMLFGCSFYLLCIPFALFMASMLPDYRRLFHIFAAVFSVYAFLRIVLYMAGLANFEVALWLLHLLIGVFILVVNVILWLPMLRSARTEAVELYLAVTVFTLIAGFSLISFYWDDKLDQLRCGYSSGFYVGILIFVLIMIVSFARRVRQMRQMAFKAEFLERRAYTDELTDLLNVKGFDDKCAELLRDAPAGHCYAVVDFDVNCFSQYNANNGLDSGDELLCRIATRLHAFCRADELCARQEADHFVCLLGDHSLEAVLERVRAEDQSIHDQTESRSLLLSYGVVEVTDRSLSPAALRDQALVAKRTVKGNYEKNIAVYDSRLHELQLQEIALLTSFETALDSGEYVIFLQPKITVATERLGGAEALVRRIQPDGTVIAAGTIIEALERKGFVAKLDYYILEKVCQFQRRCLDEGRAICPISSNFSRVHLFESDFPERVAATVDAYDIPHEMIEIELTETVFFAGKEALRSMVQRLHGHGFRVDIDDFGSGYSSLNILKDVEVDAIKLDREFLADFETNDRAGTIIEHAISLAQQMGITSVAEGIETVEQLDFLRGLGCDLVQGYYYSRPLPEAEFTAKYLS